MTEPENHTLILLREMRAESREEFAKLRADMDARFANVDSRFDTIEKRLDAMNRQGLKALKSFIGHRTIFERTMATVDEQMSRLEMRMQALEDARPVTG